MNEYMNANREHWNELVPIHEKSDMYDVEGFKAGESSLKSIELDELGDVEGKSLLHLQCHFGKDTLSWARLGAKVTGVDFSEEGIALARSLSEDIGVEANFVVSNVYDLPDALDAGEKFDIVFTSYGVLCWLPDLTRWGQIVAHFLKPGGTFYIAEFHPFGMVFYDGDDATGLSVHYPYFYASEPMKFEPDGYGSYADRSATVTTPEFEWNHGLGDVLNALISAGLKIEFLHEFPYSCYQYLPSLMEKCDDGYWRLKDKGETVPLMYSIKATK